MLGIQPNGKPLLDTPTWIVLIFILSVGLDFTFLFWRVGKTLQK
jgi:hypothetical protein